MDLIYESSIPDTCDMGNLIFHKRYEEAIENGLLLLETATADNMPMIYINLMTAYTKIGDIENSNKYAILSIKSGHTTLLSYDRLTINLKKQKRFHSLLNVCDIILDRKFKVSYFGSWDRSKIMSRYLYAKRHLNESKDSEGDAIFAKEEIDRIIQQSIKKYNKQEEIAKREYPSFEEWLEQQKNNQL